MLNIYRKPGFLDLVNLDLAMQILCIAHKKSLKWEQYLSCSLTLNILHERIKKIQINFSRDAINFHPIAFYDFYIPHFNFI